MAIGEEGETALDDSDDVEDTAGIEDGTDELDEDVVDNGELVEDVDVVKEEREVGEEVTADVAEVDGLTEAVLDEDG